MMIWTAPYRRCGNSFAKIQKVNPCYPPKKKRCNNPQTPFLWLCSARLCLLQFFIFFRWQLLNKQKHKQLSTVSSAIQLIRNKACRKKETIRHKDEPGCRARAPSRSSASFPGNDSGIPTFPSRSSCSTTDLTRRCAADSAAPSGSASSPCRIGWTRCLRKKRHNIGDNIVLGRTMHSATSGWKIDAVPEKLIAAFLLPGFRFLATRESAALFNCYDDKPTWRF